MAQQTNSNHMASVQFTNYSKVLFYVFSAQQELHLLAKEIEAQVKAKACISSLFPLTSTVSDDRLM